MTALTLGAGTLQAQARSGGAPASVSASGPLVVFNAGSLAYPFRELLRAFARAEPGVQPMQESSGSLEAARKLTELGKVPDVLAVADYGVIAKLLMPAQATWYVTFASNAMVLAYGDRSAGAKEITGQNWWRILLRPQVRWGAANPALDPNGYRTHLVFQLAEAHYREPGLARRLERALRPELVRPNEAQLVALVQSGELDYAWSYQSLARTAGLKWVDLPHEVDLSDPTLAGWYAQARVRLPGSRLGSADSVEFAGEPIVYAMTIPAAAPHPALAKGFVRFVLGEEGRKILAGAGFRLLSKPGFTGAGPEVLK
ncbi:MAG TPA: extracellular solute-binding protein [Gemmatimonadales bacterium]|nr:extracellular solute-binding protein [Gemmatimonadales bacterium]